MDSIFLWVLLIFWLLFSARQHRIRDAREADIEAEEALQRWIEEHPNVSLSWPSAQALIQERIRTRRAYVKACPAVDDDGILERWLQSLLTEQEP